MTPDERDALLAQLARLEQLGQALATVHETLGRVLGLANTELVQARAFLDRQTPGAR